MTVAVGVTSGCTVGVFMCVCTCEITCDHDIKNYTKYEFGYNFLLKSPFLFIISIAP